MAGDCPHSAHLVDALQHHHHDTGGGGGGGPPLLVDTHETYLKIIDELKNDLEQMSCEVVRVQKECCSQDKSMKNDGVDLASSLKELELQNDRLEQALKLQTQAKEAAYTELETNNHALKCQIEHLTQALTERDGHIMHLRSVLQHLPQKQQIESCRAKAVEYSSGPSAAASTCYSSSSKRISELEKRLETLSTELDKSQRQEHFLHSETRKLNEELNDSKRKNGDLVIQSQRLAGLLKTQESHRIELAMKYDTLEQNFEDQSKKLRVANAQLTILNERFQLMERQQNEHNMERKLLRDEVMSLKEKEAVVMGRQKSMQEQLMKTEKELYTAHDVMREQQNIMKSNELAHAEELQRQKEENYDVKRKLKTLIEDYKRLQEAYENEQEICKQSEKLLGSFRKWKEHQLFAEVKTREAFKEYEEYVGMLYKDKQELLNAHRVLRQDYSVLEAELERVRRCSLNLSNPQMAYITTDRSIADRLELIRQTKNRIMEDSASLRAELQSETNEQAHTTKTATATATSEKPSEGPP